MKGFALMAAWSAASLAAPAIEAGTDSPTHLKDQPCAGCLASLPAGDDPAPLLVVLHGDGESASGLFDKWRRLTEPRGVALVALACPPTEGCRGSWWRWNGDPGWIDGQIAQLGKRRPIDHDRLWLAGWSGGASYAGYQTQRFERTFAAIVIHGGGIPPGRSDCAATKPPVYFLVGDHNPLHNLAVQLREHYETCGQDVRWTLLKGADHAGEWAALDRLGGSILDWLQSQRRMVLAASPATEPGAREAPAPIVSDPKPSRVSPSRPPTSSCSSVTRGSAGPPGFALLGLLVASLRTFRRSTRPARPQADGARRLSVAKKW